MILAMLLAALFVYQSLDVVEQITVGKKYYWTGNFKKSVESFGRAAKLEPDSSLCHLWLGRAYGRLAESSGFVSAPKHASQVRLHFEKAVELAPESLEALSDLFDYYLNAPHFLGGGVEKAETLAARIAELDEAEGRCASAKLSEKRKKFKEAEEHFKEAVWLEPESIGRLLDLAKFLARRGRISESEEVFKKIEESFPGYPDTLFARAETYIQSGRNLDMAREMLTRYLSLELDENHPAPFEAERLLKKISEN
jgi:tetratricopeptide (TPR) repeat protein